MGAKADRHVCSPAVAPLALAEALPFVQENMPDYEAFDKNGYIWGRPGHFPLWITIGNERMRSTVSTQLVHVRNSKKQIWHQSGIWPWWIYHESS